MCRIAWICAAALLVGLPAAADTISFEGKTHKDVYVVTGQAMYFVHFPETGEVVAVPKAKVQGKVKLTEEPSARGALRDRWTVNNDKRMGREPEAAKPSGASAIESALQMMSVGQASSAQTRPSLRVSPEAGTNERVTDGMVRHVRLDNVPLGKALKGTLRPLNLDYRVEDGYVWVSTPEKLRTESSETLDTRYYDLKAAGAETMPKVVVGNPGGAKAGFGGGGFGGTGGFGGSGGVGGGQFGGGGFGGGGTAGGGFGGGGFGGGGAGGGYGGGGQGGNIGGGGFGGSFYNISQLFSNIDDRLVGEPPAVIGGGHVLIGGGNANYRAHQGQYGSRAQSGTTGARPQGGRY